MSLSTEITREGIKITSPIEPDKSIVLNALGAFLDDASGYGGLPISQHELMRLLDVWAGIGATDSPGSGGAV